ncbi:MAG: hypothetical protein M0P47_09215 [Bacteroidales bacterium]|nr:hypothetical protein [Bacteroidales bacterium]
MRSCNCPVGTYLTPPGTQTCPESIGQLQKLIFQRQSSTVGYGTGTTILSEATWTAAKGLTETTPNDKIIISPFISGFTPELGKAKEYGSGNEVRDGIPIIFGTEPTKVTLKLFEPTDSVIRNLKTLACESISIGFVNEKGQIVCYPTVAASGLPDAGPGATTVYFGWPVNAFHVSDRFLGGLDGPDYVEISFSLKPGWSDYLDIITPTDFSGLDL